MTTHYTILAGKISGQRNLAGNSPRGCRVERAWLPSWLSWQIMCLQCRRPKFDSWVRRIPGEGNGNPLQYSCLENPMDRGTWWTTVHGVTRVGHYWVISLHFILHLLAFSSCSFLTINTLAQGIKQDPSCQMSTKCVWIGLNTITITSLPGIVGPSYSLLGHLSPLRRTLSLRYITHLLSLFLIFSLRKTSWFHLRFSYL